MKAHQLRIFIVDRDGWDADRAKKLTEKAGYIVCACEKSGLDWVESWKQHRPDIVIFDLILPGNDGFQCMERIRMLNSQFGVQSLCILTHPYQGLLANHIEMKAYTLGAETVLKKPYSDERFLLALNNCVDITKKRVHIAL